MAWARARAAKQSYADLGGIDDQRLFTAAEIERRFGVSRRTIGRLVREGKLRPTPVGARMRILGADWRRYVAGVRPSLSASADASGATPVR